MLINSKTKKERNNIEIGTIHTVAFILIKCHVYFIYAYSYDYK